MLGIMVQCEIFPIRFIIELLNKQCRIVLTGEQSTVYTSETSLCISALMTGFSFGGLLASAVAALVWDTPYISADLLKDNMTCVTFGQPHVAVNVIQRVAKSRPEMVATINAIFIDEDQVPSLMGLLDECWSDKVQQAQSRSALGVQLSALAINHSQSAVTNTYY